MFDLANTPAGIMHLMWRRSVGPCQEQREQQPLVKYGIPRDGYADVKNSCDRVLDSGIVTGNGKGIRKSKNTQETSMSVCLGQVFPFLMPRRVDCLIRVPSKEELFGLGEKFPELFERQIPSQVRFSGFQDLADPVEDNWRAADQSVYGTASVVPNAFPYIFRIGKLLCAAKTSHHIQPVSDLARAPWVDSTVC